MSNQKKKGMLWIITGAILVALAVGLTGYNLWITHNAGEDANSVAEKLTHRISVISDDLPATGTEITYPDYLLNPDMDMPVSEIEGYSYIGILEIPVLGLKLPIQDDWSYTQMKISPCRYTGSAYQNNMVICGHNYRTHFGRLKTLKAGDTVIFTDMDGNQFVYQVVETEILDATAVEEMVTEKWDLTLFTCTVGGVSRVTVRCTMADK